MSLKSITPEEEKKQAASLSLISAIRNSNKLPKAEKIPDQLPDIVTTTFEEYVGISPEGLKKQTKKVAVNAPSAKKDLCKQTSNEPKKAIPSSNNTKKTLPSTEKQEEKNSSINASQKLVIKSRNTKIEPPKPKPTIKKENPLKTVETNVFSEKTTNNSEKKAKEEVQTTTTSVDTEKNILTSFQKLQEATAKKAKAEQDRLLSLNSLIEKVFKRERKNLISEIKKEKKEKKKLKKDNKKALSLLAEKEAEIKALKKKKKKKSNKKSTS